MKCVILTASDSSYFYITKRLINSLFVPLTIVDLGLSPQDLEFCEGKQIQTVKPTSFVVPKHIPMWQTWNKPFFFDLIPNQHILWIDADCIVNKPLNNIVEYVENTGLVLVEHWFWDCKVGHGKEFYNLYPCNTVDKFFNAGVVGIDKNRDMSFHFWWKWLIRDLTEKNRLGMLKWWDETAAQWALYLLNWKDRIVPYSSGWNHWPTLPINTEEDLANYRRKTKATIIHLSGEIEGKRFHKVLDIGKA